MITVVILTKNEEQKILNCIKTIEWANEIIVIDDYSIDNTVKVVKNFNKKIKVYKRKLDDNFARQRNFGISKAKSEWIMFLDPDEVVSKSLREEILLKTKDSKTNGFYIKRRDNFLGKELKYGETGNIKLLRLARKNSGKWKRKVHEYWDVKGQIGELDNYIIHNKQSLRDFVCKINFYAKLHAIELKKENKKSNIYKIILWPSGKFVVNYFIKLGFLDGVEGFIVATIMSFHSFLAWVYLLWIF